MKLKKFKEYSDFYSKDPKNFEKRVIFACSEDHGAGIFQHIKDPADQKFINSEAPIIVWDNFNYEKPAINESKSFIFNQRPLPSSEEVYSRFEGERFIPRSTKNRAEVKGLKFPITAHGESDDEFKTYGKFRKSEKSFSKFREKVVPRSKFDVIAFKSEPIHVQEKINSLGFDVDLRTFEYADQVENIVSEIAREYSPDFFHLSLLEAGGKLYFNKIGTSLNLSPSQSIKMYERAYENYYVSKLPSWFKKSAFETYVKPYYEKRHLDAALIKPKYAIDFKKY